MELLNEVGATTTWFIEAYGLAAIFVVILLKESGVPLPVPGDFLLVAAATQAASGRLVLWEVFAVLMVAVVAGAWLQYLLARGAGRTVIYRYGRFLGLPARRLEMAAGLMRRGGAPAVGLSLLIPGVRAAAVTASGLAGLPQRSFVPGLIAGSAGFLALHFAIGYAAGPISGAVPAGTALSAASVVATPLAAAAATWLAMRSR